MLRTEATPDYSPRQDGFPMPLFDDGFKVDDSIILDGSQAEIGARINGTDIEIFEEGTNKGITRLAVNFHRTEDRGSYEEPVCVDTSFDKTDPEHIRGLLHAILSSKARKNTYLN